MIVRDETEFRNSNRRDLFAKLHFQASNDSQSVDWFMSQAGGLQKRNFGGWLPNLGCNISSLIRLANLDQKAAVLLPFWPSFGNSSFGSFGISQTAPPQHHLSQRIRFPKPRVNRKWRLFELDLRQRFLKDVFELLSAFQSFASWLGSEGEEEKKKLALEPWQSVNLEETRSFCEPSRFTRLMMILQSNNPPFPTGAS